MKGEIFSIYNSKEYISEELGNFFAVKNLMNPKTMEIIGFEDVLLRQDFIQLEDIGKYCYVPGSYAMVMEPNIICYTDFYLVDNISLEIIRKISAYRTNNDEVEGFMILCDTKYASEHRWME